MSLKDGIEALSFALVTLVHRPDRMELGAPTRLGAQPAPAE